MDPEVFVTFDAPSEFEDEELNESGDATTPPGQRLASLLRDGLAALGFDVSQVAQHSFYGWSATVRKDNCKAWVLLQYAEQWTLIFDVRRTLLQYLRVASLPKCEVHVKEALDSVIRRNTQLTNVTWHKKSEWK